MGRRRRVLHVAQPSDAGVAVVVRQLVGHQVRDDWDVGVACDPSGALNSWVGETSADRFAWAATRQPGPHTLAETLRLRRIVHTYRPDVVHLHSSKAGLAGRLAVRGRRATVFQPHAWSFLAVGGATRRLSVEWERAAARWADVAICVSADERDLGVAQRIDARWAVCPNGVDLTRFRPVSPTERELVRAGLGLAGRTVVVCVGRLCEQKGQDVLLDAWRRACTPGAVLVLVGDGPLRSSLEVQAEGLGIQDQVRFVGDVDDPAPWFQAASFAVQPSRWEAAASLTTREAMAAGLGVVASAAAGTREVVGAAGAVVAIGDPVQLAAAIHDRLRDADLREREGSTARALAEKSFDLAAACAAVTAVYGQVLDSRST